MSTKYCNYIYQNGPDCGIACNQEALATSKCQFHSHPIFLYEYNKELSVNHVDDIARWIRVHPDKIWEDFDYNKNGTNMYLYLTYLQAIENGDRFIIAYEENI